MRRFFTSLVFVITATSAQAQADPQDSPWEQKGPDTWTHSVDGIGRNESFTLIRSPQGKHFTASTPCPDSNYTEIYYWDDGHKHAKGVDCSGKRVHRETTYWEGWVYPLPYELRKNAHPPSKRRVVAM